MRKAILPLLAVIGITLQAQDKAKYEALVQEADSLYGAKDLLGSAQRYSSAFAYMGGGGTMEDKYNAACSWALAEIPDSAFNQLSRLAERADYDDVPSILLDHDLNQLRADTRWPHLVALVSANRYKAQANLNRPLAHLLDSIFIEDQRYRQQGPLVEQQYGRDSEEWKTMLREMDRSDSTNINLVRDILDKHGWLGADSVGETGNVTFFAVIQHADLATQQRYLPMMRAAAAKGNADGGDLAYVEDRMALDEGKRQVYGSQIGFDKDTGNYYILPLEDPDHVDERRKKVRLSPIADYVGHWDIMWDVEQYKAQLPALEAKWRAERKRAALLGSGLFSLVVIAFLRVSVPLW